MLKVFSSSKVFNDIDAFADERQYDEQHQDTLVAIFGNVIQEKPRQQAACDENNGVPCRIFNAVSHDKNIFQLIDSVQGSADRQVCDRIDLKQGEEQKHDDASAKVHEGPWRKVCGTRSSVS